MSDRNMLLFKFLQAVQFFMLLFTTARATDVVITHLDLPLSGEAAFHICWTSTIATFVYAELTVIQGVTEMPLTGAVTSGEYCATFQNDISLIVPTGTSVTFVLRLYNPTPFSVSTLFKESVVPDGKGMATIDLWPDVKTLAGCDSAYKVAGGFGTMKTLRIHYTMVVDPGDKLVADGSIPVGQSDSTKTTVYYIFADTPAPSSVKICRTVLATINEVDQTMDICRYPQDVEDATTTAPVISEAVLDYTTPAATTVTASLASGSDKFETIHYWESATPEQYEFSSLCENSITCTADKYTTGLKTLNIVLVDYSSGDVLVMLGASRLPFQDFNVASSFIFSSTLEMMWEPSNKVTTSTFEITIVCDKTIDNGFTSATVTCDPTDSGCYGYFLGIPDDATTCTCSLQPDKGLADPEKKITITTAKPTTAHTTNSDLSIRHVKMEWNQNDLEAIALVCFNHTSYDAETDFSHYEFVMVNHKGQWLKHKLLSQDTEGDICFSSFTVNTNTFDVTGRVNLLVTQRAIDGFAVLAAGETYIAFNRNSSKSSN